MKKLLAQARKEWMQLRRDRLVLALGVLMPLVLMLIFGTSQSLRLRQVPLAVYDYDNTPASRAYLEGYGASLTFSILPSAFGQTPQAVLDAGDAKAVLVIPAAFARDLQRGASPEVQLLIDGTDSNSATGLQNMVQALNRSFLERQGLLGREQASIRLEQRLWYNPGLSNPLYFGTGALGLVLVLFPALLGALAAAREYELGTIVQAYASSLSAPEWILGKALPYVILGLVELVLCFGLGLWLFGYRLPSDPTVLLVATVFYLIAGVLYGMLLGNVTGTQSAAIQGVQMGAFLVSLLLSGFLFPVRNVPVQLRWISALLPATHYVQIVRNSVLRDVGWTASAGRVGALVLLALLFFGANMVRMRRMRWED